MVSVTMDNNRHRCWWFRYRGWVAILEAFPVDIFGLKLRHRP